MLRSEARKEFAEKINGLSKKDLWSLGVSRTSQITGMDVIGCPTWSSCRPLSRTIALNSGKSRVSEMARAGSILESSEYQAGENPWGEAILAPYSEVEEDAVDYRSLPLIHGSILHEDMPIEWECVTDVISGKNKLIPSGVCWIYPRSKTFIAHFQNSTNGIASGYSIIDAIISGLYEVIERDAWTISEECNAHRVVNNIPDSVKELISMASRSGIKTVVLSCTQNDINIPTFGAIIYGDGSGICMGHGSNRCPVKAMERAVLEAYQSRCVYISGARDDIFRRNFLITKKRSQKEIEEAIQSLARDDSPYPELELEEIEDQEEIMEVSKKVKDAGFNDIFVKHLNTFEFTNSAIPVVKVIVPGLETCKMDGQWTPSPRCIKKKSLYI